MFFPLKASCISFVALSPAMSPSRHKNILPSKSPYLSKNFETLTIEFKVTNFLLFVFLLSFNNCRKERVSVIPSKTIISFFEPSITDISFFPIFVFIIGFLISYPFDKFSIPIPKYDFSPDW